MGERCNGLLGAQCDGNGRIIALSKTPLPGESSPGRPGLAFLL